MSGYYRMSRRKDKQCPAANNATKCAAEECPEEEIDDASGD